MVLHIEEETVARCKCPWCRLTLVQKQEDEKNNWPLVQEE